ncbi:MAG: hypothetical protein ABGW72_00975 [bacterium]|jgi:hypothetical protein|nr:hypothetical protein [Candidatus Neomarinimicrobiota bacterium]HIL86315.1 hypothetical protein [Candidatus Neomarinimicrobiota bacterium]
MDSFDLNNVDEVISPCCDEEIKTSEIGPKLKCPLCKANLKQRIYLPFLEYLMENGHVENLDFFDLDLYSQDKEALDSEDEELDLDKYEVKKDSLNIYEDDSKFTATKTPSQTSIDESAVSSDWVQFATEDSDS